MKNMKNVRIIAWIVVALLMLSCSTPIDQSPVPEEQRNATAVESFKTEGETVPFDTVEGYMVYTNTHEPYTGDRYDELVQLAYDYLEYSNTIGANKVTCYAYSHQHYVHFDFVFVKCSNGSKWFVGLYKGKVRDVHMI